MRRLPERVVSLIAAGEVIERPADVVKELVENSLDAGARRIRIRVSRPVLREISVQDDGCGMSREDAVLAVERHTTSKISSEEDLQGITTLGFRGEALASIAAVSRMEILTRRAEDPVGTRVLVEGGRLVAVEEAPSPPGTRVTVRDLFYNVPVRRKFLGPDRSEFALVAETVSRLAIPRNDVYFVLERNRKISLALPPSSPFERVSRILRLSRDDLLEFSRDNVHIFLSRPGISFPRNRIYTYVNGRYVRSEVLKKAILEAYGSRIPKGEFPAAVLLLSLDPREMDVNVHPKKYEIRFRDQEAVFRAVFEAVSAALGPGIIPEVSGMGPSSGPSGTFRVVGQALNTYIILEDDEGILLVDQHAAHERIRFEELLDRVRSGEGYSTPLLEPMVVDLPPDLAPLLGDPLLRRIGFEVEPFGEGAALVRKAPYLLTGRDVGEALREVLEMLSSKGDAGLEDLLIEGVKLAACRGAIKAGEPLSREKMEDLVRRLMQCREPQTCPHGRPTMIRISRSRLEAFFGRH